MENMYNPCLECYNRYDRQYSEECDNTCQYAHILSKLKPYGSIDDIIKVLKGDSFPLVLVDEEHFDFTYKFVCMVKDGII